MKKLCYMTMAVLAFGLQFLASNAQTDTIVVPFTSVGSATWTVPAGTKTIFLEAIGGGGAGGRASGSGLRFRCASGGSGAAYAMSELGVNDFVPGQTFSITVGKGGTDGVNGTASEVKLDGVTWVSAAGGVSISGSNVQTGATAQPASASKGDVVHVGGNGSSSAGNNVLPLFVANAGGGGGAGGSVSNGGNATAATTSAGGGGVGGSGGGDLHGGYPSGSGGTGTGTWSDVPQGHEGNNYGGGGSGAWATGWGNHAGGEGAQGVVVITYVMTLEIEDTTAAICTGSSFQIAPLGIIPDGTTYSWDAPAIDGITGAEAGTDQPTVFGTLENHTTSDIQVDYEVTASNGVFTDLFTVSVTVFALPDPGTIEEDILSCTAGDTIKTFTSVQDATSTVGQYSWQKSVDGFSWTTIDMATNNEYTPSFLDNVGTTYYRRAYTTDCGTSFSNVLSMTYPGTIDPGEITSTNTTLNYCPGTPVNATLEAHASVQSGEIPSVQWQSSPDGDNWNDISGAQEDTYVVDIEELLSPIHYRYFVTLAGCTTPIYANNVWSYAPYAVTDFDDEDVVITLWYGACDTLYNVTVPTISHNFPDYVGTIELSNNVSNLNEGPVLGRLVPGTYTINWTVADPCGTTVIYPKNYIVRYPNCGEDDPNYAESYTVTYDGYTYSTVRIGCECWLKENLRNLHDAQANDIAVARAYMDDENNLDPYGRLYSWYSAMQVTEGDNTSVPTTALSKRGITYVQGICPAGWALPAASQYDNMMSYAGQEARRASSAQEDCWLPEAVGITPGNGFDAAGAGYYDTQGDRFYNLLAETYFWNASETERASTGKVCIISHICPYLMQKEKPKTLAGSVRCVKVDPVE
ncbi:MAG: hypothetical protein IKU03_09570 [Bacteroidales bacterium]|nr:hypothetical protein [Bacteroidales bacterium]